MYRNYKFQRHFRVATKEDLKKQTRVIASPDCSNYQQVIGDYLRILRKRYPQNIFALNSLQTHLMQDIAISEKTIRGYKSHLESLDREKQKGDLEHCETQVDLHHLFRNKLKDIGDALAWKLFDYDRSKIFIFSNHPDSGFLQAEGLFSEIGVWLSEYYSEGRLPVLNSVTNCLRVGDVTAKDNNGDILVYEVKSSIRGGRSRKRKQLKVMDDLVGLLNNDRKIEGSIEMRLIHLSFYPQNYMDKINTLMSQAYGRGYGLIKLNEFSFVEIVNYELVDDMKKVIKELSNLKEPIIHDWDERRHNFNNLNRFDFSPINAPYSIFPFKESICADLMFGKLVLSYIINFTKFEKFLQGKGLRILKRPEEIISENPQLALQYLYILSKDKFHMKIPPMSLSKLFFEFCHPNVFIKEYLGVMSNLDYGEEPQVIVVNDQDEKKWK